MPSQWRECWLPQYNEFFCILLLPEGCTTLSSIFPTWLKFNPVPDSGSMTPAFRWPVSTRHLWSCWPHAGLYQWASYFVFNSTLFLPSIQSSRSSLQPLFRSLTLIASSLPFYTVWCRLYHLSTNNCTSPHFFNDAPQPQFILTLSHPHFTKNTTTDTFERSLSVGYYGLWIWLFLMLRLTEIFLNLDQEVKIAGTELICEEQLCN